MTRGTGRTQDSRAHSRIQTFLSCKIRLGETTYSGLLHDISYRGAFVSSSCIPASGESVAILVEVPELKQTLTLEGQVVRRSVGLSEIGEVSRFGVRLSHVSRDSLQLVKALLERSAAGR